MRQNHTDCWPWQSYKTAEGNGCSSCHRNCATLSFPLKLIGSTWQSNSFYIILWHVAWSSQNFHHLPQILSKTLNCCPQIIYVFGCSFITITSFLKATLSFPLFFATLLTLSLRLIHFIRANYRSIVSSSFWRHPSLSFLYRFVLSTFNQIKTAPSSLWILLIRLHQCRCLTNRNSRKSAIAWSFSFLICTAPTK